LILVADPREYFGGGRIKAGVAVPPLGFSAGPAPQPVDVNGLAGQLGVGPDKVYLTWSPAPSLTAYVEGTRATTDQVLTVARGLKFAAGYTSVEATAIPPGLEAVPLVLTDGTTNNWAEYTFERDGASLQVHFYDGGRATLETRVDDPAHSVNVHGTTGALRDHTGENTDLSHYWVDFPDGHWTIEVAGGPFPNETSFLAAVDALRVAP